MTIIATFSQQPADKLDYDVWYANAPDGTPDWLSANDTIISQVATVAPVGLILDALKTADRVKLWVSGGTSGVTYKVTLTVTTEAGRVKQDELKFRIKEI
jgi:hypothetical protein